MVFEFQRRLVTKIRIKNILIRECIGEFVGTVVLLIFGTGVLAQTKLGDFGNYEHGSFIAVSVGWGFAVMMGMYYGGKSGKGIINPALTFAYAVTGKIRWKLVPLLTISQFLGAFMGSLLVYITYLEKINDYSVKYDNTTFLVNSTGEIFVTYPHASLLVCFWDQVFGTALLCGGIYAIVDSRSYPLPEWTHPVAVALLVTSIVGSFALNVGVGLNPARDLGPRLMLLMFGWGNKVFTSNDYYFVIPILGPYIGACLGAVMYEMFVGIHLPYSRELAIRSYEIMEESNDEQILENVSFLPQNNEIELKIEE